jgi:hypothetical protein
MAGADVTFSAAVAPLSKGGDARQFNSYAPFLTGNKVCTCAPRQAALQS